MLNDFKNLMAARFLFTFAVQMQAVVIGWRMYTLTHDPLFLGLIGLSEAIPAIGLALYAGYVVDRSRPLRIYKWVVVGSLVSGLILLVSQIPEMKLNDHTQIIALFLSSFLTGAARGFSQPAVFAIVPRLVPREALSRASAWMTTAMQIARISGPAIGGLVFGWMGMAITAGLVCIFLLLSQVALALIKTSPLPPQITKPRGSVKEELLSGALFVLRHPILLPALTLDMISVLFGGVTALLPIYASDILLIGPKGLGTLRAAPAIGAALTSLFLTKKDIGARAGPFLFSAVAGFGVCILVFALSRDFMLSLISLGLSGAFDSVSMVIRTTAVQLSSPDSMRGRISAVNSIFIGSSNEIGEFESGIAARLLGTVPSAVFGGVMCLLTVSTVAIFSPALRKMDLKKLGSTLVE
jgi:MFS family permease